MSLPILLSGYAPSILLAIGAVVLLCWQRLSVQLGPQEPPLLKPAVSYIGHILGLIRYQSGYFDKLNAKSPTPICTLPMINAKTYLVTSPVLVQNVFRSKNLSFEPFMIEFVQGMLGVSNETINRIKTPASEKRPSFIGAAIKEMHTAMMGEHLHKMNAHALGHVAASVNKIGETFETQSLYYWLRSMMTVATTNSLLGSHNPVSSDPSLVDSLWDFDDGILSILMLPFASTLAPKPYIGRAAVQSALMKYYTARHDLDSDVSRLAKVRASVCRAYGFTDSEIGRMELALLQVATSNAIPTSFWTLIFIASSPTLIASIRKELMSIIKTNSTQDTTEREISVNISQFSTHCPLLVSTYQETTRLANSQVVTRRVMADTTISDGKSSYLLKKGADVQMPAGVAHMASTNWGANASEFDPRRFLQPEEKGLLNEQEKEEFKTQKRSFFPFGGGKHLCPGRSFAFAEILGTIAIMVLGFDITGSDGQLLKVPKIGRASLAEAIVKPGKDGLEIGAKFSRRKGWEDVVWSFHTDQE